MFGIRIVKVNSNKQGNFAVRDGAWLKGLVLILLVVACLGSAAFLIWHSYSVQDLDRSAALYKDFITLILSFIPSLIVGYWYARVSSIEKVDTIAERSTEKMVLLSIQLEELRSYLEDTIEVASSQGNMSGMLLAYQHRTDAAAYLISSLASSNETFRGDWLGVVSPHMRLLIEDKYKTLREYFDASHTLRERRSPSALAGDSGSETDTGALIAQAQLKIDEIRKDLPIPHYTLSPSFPRAVAVAQNPEDGGDEFKQSGEIVIEVLRSIYAVTGTGKLSPKMIGKPRVTIQLIRAPDGVSHGNLRTSVGVGTNFDFNIKLGSNLPNIPLHMGPYVLRYYAQADGEAAHGM